jgi:hypothetical protein
MGVTPEQAVAADLQKAIAEALEESEFPTDEKVAADSWEEWDSAAGELDAPAASDGDEQSTDDSSEEPGAAEGDEPQLDIPDFYKGMGLEQLPAEVAKGILNHLQQQDSYIGKLQERLAVEPDPATPEPPAEPEEVTDEALAIALGYDPEDQYNQPSAAELARTVLALEDKLDEVTAKETTREVQTQWNTSLDELEASYGKLPFDRLQVLRYAVEENIASPFEVYFRLTAPAKKAAETAVAEARRAAAKKAEAGGVKPRSSAGDAPVIDPKTTSLRDATKLAMLEAEKETGLHWKGIFGRKVRVEE